MAGAGYKLFTTGQVLTAAEVNTYLQEQTVMVFNDAASRTTALSGVLAEGMVSYLKSTKVVEIYNGTAWASLDDPNAIQNTIVDAKGDLIAATGNDVPARLAVGNNGETLVADSSASTGLRWQGDYAAGKNKIINGDMSIWQRGTSFTNPAAGSYSADRWFFNYAGTFTGSISQQAFTPGTAPAAPYESSFFLRINRTNSTSIAPTFYQKVEDVRTLANQTVTFSFWAKADSARSVGVNYFQNFGSGGSAGVTGSVGTASLTTSFQRFTFTFTMPSISGKTIGTSNFMAVYFDLPDSVTFTLDFWGFQLEAGSVATAFQTATGTLAGEISACQRYYWRMSNTGFEYYGIGYAEQATQFNFNVALPVRMRTKPSISSSAAGSIVAYRVTTGVASTSVVTLNQANTDTALLYFTTAAGTLTQYSPYVALSNNQASYIEFSAEL